MIAKTPFRKISLIFSTIGLSLALGACGGGGGDSRLGSSNPLDTPPQAQVPGPQQPPASNPGTEPAEPGTEPTEPGKEPEPGTPPAGEHETPIAEDTPPEVVEGLVQLRWQRPVDREDGEYLELDEIGGYELRYKAKGDTEEQSVIIDAAADSYQLSGLKGEYWFEIAVYDKNGLYSQFVSLTPYN
jgi:hypothetical protein